MELATVLNTLDPMHAEIVRSRLEVAGFDAVITHGLSAFSTEGYTLTTGGVLVQVPENEATDARLLIDSQPDGVTPS